MAREKQKEELENCLSRTLRRFGQKIKTGATSDAVASAHLLLALPA